jgi:cyanobactin maturation PatA/PatG family protease
MGASVVSQHDLLVTLGLGDPRICIAVLDGPLDRSHPCFQGANLIALDTAVCTAPLDGVAAAHGTHVASVIFGQPSSPVKGLAPLCRGLIVPIFGDDSLGCSQLDLARAISLALENGAHIINISGGQLTPSGEAEPILAQAIESCVKRNVLIVAAAGNDGCECLHVPAATPSVLAIGAMDRDGKPLASSNWGSAYRTQGILAPGTDVLGAVPGGGVARKSGTSFAAPLVAGLAGLLASLQVRLAGSADPHAIRMALLNSATPCLTDTSDDCRRILSGRLNIAGAIEQIVRGEKSMTEAATISLSECPVFAPLGTNSEPPGQPSMPLAPRSLLPDNTVRMSEDGKMEAAQTPSISPLTPDAMNALKKPPVPGPNQIRPSDCGCGGGSQCTCGCGTAQKPTIYALGRIGYDFGSDARRDSFIQAMPTNENNPLLPEQLLAFLDTNPYDAPSVVWTLNLDATPIYAIQPAGAYAAQGYERLREFLRGQIVDGVELVSVPGVVDGSVRLQSGQILPVVVPALRGMFSWASQPLVTSVLGARPGDSEEQARFDAQATGLTDFLNRIYYDLRNLGLTAEDRALNYSATNAFQIADVIRSATREELDLDTVDVKKSPVCRPDSDCYDVELAFFNPNNTAVASRIYRFTVDVSDVIPVTLGTVRSWTRRV